MNLRKILSLIVSSAMLTSIITANTANAVTSTSVPKTETVHILLVSMYGVRDILNSN